MWAGLGVGSSALRTGTRSTGGGSPSQGASDRRVLMAREAWRPWGAWCPAACGEATAGQGGNRSEVPCAGEGTCHPRDHPPEMASCGGSSRGEGEGRRGGGPGEGCASAPPACAGSEGPGRSGFPRSPSRSGSQGERRQARASRGRTCCPAQPSSASCTSTAGSGTRSSPETREPLVEL